MSDLDLLKWKHVWRDMDPRKIPSTLTVSGELFTYIDKESKIVDLGCGSGKTIFDLTKQGFKYLTGVDVNFGAVRTARNEGIRNEIGFTEFIVADATQLPFCDRAFDFGIMQALLTVLINPHDLVLSFNEAFRLLKPRGHLYIADFARTDNIEKYRERYDPSISMSGFDGTFPVYDSQSGRPIYFAHHFSGNELLQLSAEAGFEVVTAQRRVGGFPTRSGSIVDGWIVILRKP
jgi:ubiquinone/menaquinone biosynthesis C-methylase UbiE